jgi:hypothetical protein
LPSFTPRTFAAAERRKPVPLPGVIALDAVGLLPDQVRGRLSPADVEQHRQHLDLNGHAPRRRIGVVQPAALAQVALLALHEAVLALLRHLHARKEEA